MWRHTGVPTPLAMTPPACSGTGFVQLTSVTFAGAEQGGAVTGTITVTRTGSGISGANTPSTSTGIGSYQVKLEENR